MKEVSEDVEIPRIYHPFIKGANETTVHSIQEITETYIHIPHIIESSDVITVSGKKKNVAKAISQIQSLHHKLVRGRFCCTHIVQGSVRITCLFPCRGRLLCL